MRVRRVRIRELAPGEAELRGDEAHHLARVLRARPGDPVRAFDGRGLEASGEVAEVAPDRVTLRLGEPEPSGAEADLRLTLAVGLLKGDKLSQVVRQGTELGVANVQLIHGRRADLPRLSQAKLARLRRVAEEAAKQSGRAAIPEVRAPVALDALPLEGTALLGDPAADATLAQVLAGERPPAVTVLTGPEGGFTAEEVAVLEGRGARPVRLGPRVLRAETAPVALAAALLLPEAL